MRCKHMVDKADKVAQVALNAQSYNEILPPIRMSLLTKSHLQWRKISAYFFFIIGRVECTLHQPGNLHLIFIFVNGQYLSVDCRSVQPECKMPIV